MHLLCYIRIIKSLLVLIDLRLSIRSFSARIRGWLPGTRNIPSAFGAIKQILIKCKHDLLRKFICDDWFFLLRMESQINSFPIVIRLPWFIKYSHNILYLSASTNRRLSMNNSSSEGACGDLDFLSFFFSLPFLSNFFTLRNISTVYCTLYTDSIKKTRLLGWTKRSCRPPKFTNPP